MFSTIVFVDDKLGNVRVMENAIQKIIKTGTVTKLYLKGYGDKPLDTQIEKVFTNSNDLDVDAWIGNLPVKTLIKLTGAQKLKGSTVYLNPLFMRFFTETANGTRVIYEQSSVRPIEIYVSQTEAQIDTLLVALTDEVYTPTP